MATFSTTHHLIVLVLKEGLGFLLPASNSILRHFVFFLCCYLVYQNKRMFGRMHLCCGGGAAPNISQLVSALIQSCMFDF